MSHIRERWVYDKDPETGEVIKYRVDPEAQREVAARLQISMDRHYENTVATDGTDIGSRRKCEEYMKRHGLARPEDYKETWAKAQKAREEWYTQGGGAKERAERREDIGRAIYQLETRRRRAR